MANHAPTSAANCGAARFEPTRGEPAALWRSIDSRQLLQGGRELRIRHGDAEYRLRETRAGKLILTK